MYLIHLLPMILGYFSLNACSSDQETSILQSNGQAARPFVKERLVRLKFEGDFNCSGVIARKKPLAVQTAAHCFADAFYNLDLTLEKYSVVLDDGSEFKPISIKVNPNSYTDQNAKYRDNPEKSPWFVPGKGLIEMLALKGINEGLSRSDIAFLHFAPDVTINTNVVPRYSTSFPEKGEQIYFGGFGINSPIDSRREDFAKEGSTYISYKVGGKASSVTGPLVSEAPFGQNTAAPGDSGGPVFNKKGQIVGVISAVEYAMPRDKKKNSESEPVDPFKEEEFSRKSPWSRTVFTDITTPDNLRFIKENIL